MNILSISQLQAQNAQSDFNILPVQDEKTYESRESSFSDYLRDAQKEMKNADEKIPSEEAEKVVKYEENSESKVDDKSTKIADDDNSEDKMEKSKKLASKKVLEDKTDEKKSAKIDENKDEGLKIAVQNLNILDNAKNKNLELDEESLEINGGVLSASDIDQIDEKTLSWLSSSNRINDSDEISNEDFAKLIDAAIEFIPGSESESEKLENAQNLAVTDPSLFLKNAEAAENLQASASLSKNEAFLDDKKLADNSKTKKNDSKLAVHDLRTRKLFEADAEKTAAKIASDKIVQKSAEKKELNLSMQKQADGNVAMTMELANRAQENITSSSNQAASANGSNFQAMLSNAVQENAPDFVKAGNIVLKDNNQGTINLILRPEGLGNVKISLNLDDKNLSAQILVHTKEAMEAFKESIPSLKQAFTESGFETGSFDLDFSGNQQNFAQGGNENQNQHNSGILARKTYGDFVTPSALSQGNANETYTDSNYGINIVA